MDYELPFLTITSCGIDVYPNSTYHVFDTLSNKVSKSIDSFYILQSSMIYINDDTH
jgi:hypothetical protein